MKNNRLVLGVALLSIAFSAGAKKPKADNPLLVESTLPYHVPPFAKISEKDFEPVYYAGMAAQRAEIDAIANNPDAPTFDNTLVALEKSGQLLTRVELVFSNLNSSYTNDTFQKLEAKLAPLLSAHRDAILLDTKLFARIKAVRDSKPALDPESAQLLERTYLMFKHEGADLDDADKAKLTALNAKISTLQTTIEQNTRAAMTGEGVLITDGNELAGLSDEDKSAYAAAAEKQGHKGAWFIALQNTTIQGVLSQLENRAVRERIAKASEGRAQVNLPLIAELIHVRAEKAALLGYPTYAHYALEEEGAKDPAKVDAILADLGAAALAQAKVEAKDIQALIDEEAAANKTERFDLQWWDWAYYAEKVRKKQYAFDEAEVKPYFELNHVFEDGIFYAATKLYGVTFTKRTDIPVYNPDVLVYDVKTEDGKDVGLFLLDVYAGDNKRGGAWMSNYVNESGLFGTRPVVVNNLNVSKPEAGKPVLLTFDEVETAFHEFGHGINGLLSDCKYPSLSGTATPPDFVEYPSQFNEMWMNDPEVFGNYAKRFDTGEPMPKELLDKVMAARRYGGGYATLEYIEAARIDMAYHELPADKLPGADGLLAFEQKTLEDSGLFYAPVPPRYRTPYFAHAFTGGYEAGYYAYIWSEVLARDTGAWFMEHGGLTRENGLRYRDLVLARGRTKEPNEMFEAFYGKPPEVGPLVEYRGLGTPAPQ